MNIKDLIPPKVQGMHVTVGMVLAVMMGLPILYAFGENVGVELPRVAMERNMLEADSDLKGQIVEVAENLDNYSQAIQRQIDNINADNDSRELRRLHAEENAIKIRIRRARDAGELPSTADELRLDQIQQEKEALR